MNSLHKELHVPWTQYVILCIFPVCRDPSDSVTLSANMKLPTLEADAVYRTDHKLMFKCLDGHVASGSNYAICLGNGTWLTVYAGGCSPGTFRCKHWQQSTLYVNFLTWHGVKINCFIFTSNVDLTFTFLLQFLSTWRTLTHIMRVSARSIEESPKQYVPQ